jgi:hypothetical protein
LLYFISAGRPIPRVCIDGNKQPSNNWLLEDGSPLTYFNWTPGDPDGDHVEQETFVIPDHLDHVLFMLFMFVCA